jgi:hypothetical protein
MKSPRFSVRKLDRINQSSDNLGTSQPNSHYKLYRTLLATAIVAGSQLLAIMSATANLPPTPTTPSPIVPTRTILNGDFQQPKVSGIGVGVKEGYTNSGLPIIWQTTEKGDTTHQSYVDKLEVWAGFESATTADKAKSPKTNPTGNQFVELNADTNGSIYQDICVFGGETVNWSLNHAVRRDPKKIVDSVNIMRVSITDPNVWQNSKTPPLDKLYESPALTTKYSDGWLAKTESWTNPITTVSPKLRFAFEAKQGSTVNGVENKSYGNFIDDVQLSLAPVIDFLPTSGGNVNLTSTIEGNTTNYYYLSLRINGKMNTDGTVNVTLTGLNSRRQFKLGNVLKGSATSTGLTASKSGNAITLSIPAGNYDANLASDYIHIPIDFSDRKKQPNDNELTFTLSNPTGGGGATTGGFTVADLAIRSTSCGATPRTTVKTKLNDDDFQKRV